MLTAVRDYLRNRGQVTLAEVALHFDVTPDVARRMLEVWRRKGKVHRAMATASCGSSCSQCDPAATEIYFWGEAPAAPPDLPGGCTGS